MELSLGDKVWLMHIGNLNPIKLVEVITITLKYYTTKDSRGFLLNVNKHTLESTQGYFSIKFITKEEKLKHLLGTLEN